MIKLTKQEAESVIATFIDCSDCLDCRIFKKCSFIISNEVMETGTSFSTLPELLANKLVDQTLKLGRMEK